MHGNCKCPHHMVAKLLMVLAWVSAILFFVSGWKETMVWGMSADQFFQVTVVLSLLLFGTGLCSSCNKCMAMPSQDGGNHGNM